MIETVAAPGYSLENYPDVQDEKAITKWLIESRSKHRHYENQSERFEYDTKSLAAIGMLRKNSHPTKIERCRAILVTQDPWIAQCMKALAPKKFLSEIDFAMLDIEVISLLWLSSQDIKGSLPMDMLIANAAAACQLTQEVMNRAIELTDQFVASGDIPEDAALLIRSQPHIRPYLLEATENDIGAISVENIQHAIDRYVEREAKKYVDDATLSLERKKQRELDQKEEEIQKLRAAVKRGEEEKEKRESLRRGAILIARRTAKKTAERFEWGIIIVSFLILLATIGIWAVKACTDYLAPLHSGWRIVFVILDIIALLQIIDYFSNPNGWIRCLSRRIKNAVYTRAYSKEIAKINIS